MAARLPLNDEQRLAWLRLARSERIGAVTFHNLINRYGTAQAALDALPEITLRTNRTRNGNNKTQPRICSEAAACKELEEAANLGIRHITHSEPDYPTLLRKTDGSPPLILVQGRANFERAPHVAIVGSRNASIVGRKMTSRLATDLAELGYIVVSGLARGIDAAAHQASLTTGTAAVIAGGHHRLYPKENIPLAESILDNGGTIVSEMPPSFQPRGRDFPRRNRIISGLSFGVVVVEAARRSGSLITARLANEQGRQVFAVPGSPLDPRADGTNDLIREGATLIRDALDITTDLSPMFAFKQNDPADGQGTLELDADSDNIAKNEVIPEKIINLILGGLGASPVHQDDIIRYTGLPSAIVISGLCELEISDRISRLEGNTFIQVN